MVKAEGAWRPVTRIAERIVSVGAGKRTKGKASESTGKEGGGEVRRRKRKTHRISK